MYCGQCSIVASQMGKVGLSVELGIVPLPFSFSFPIGQLGRTVLTEARTCNWASWQMGNYHETPIQTSSSAKIKCKT